MRLSRHINMLLRVAIMINIVNVDGLVTFILGFTRLVIGILLTRNSSTITKIHMNIGGIIRLHRRTIITGRGENRAIEVFHRFIIRLIKIGLWITIEVRNSTVIGGQRTIMTNVNSIVRLIHR